MMARIQNNPNTKDRKGQLCAPLLREGCKKYQIGTHYFASTLNCSSWVLTFGKIKILNIFFWTQKSPETNNIASPLGLNFKLPMRDTRRNLGTEDVASILVLVPGRWTRVALEKFLGFGPQIIPRSRFSPTPHFENTTEVGGESAASEERLAARPRGEPAIGWARTMNWAIGWANSIFQFNP